MIEARKLAIGYGRRVVGEGLDFALRPGEVTALLGPNGCGKTTLLKTLLGLIAPLAGEVRLDDAPLRSLSVTERARRMAYVPQHAASTFGFPVREIVLLGRTAHGRLWSPPSRHDREVADACLERMGIAHLADQPLHRVSGGERQLALVARALAQEPALILLDEPTASLDFGNQGRVLREMRRLATEGLGVIFTTHDPNHALRYADRAMLMRDGRLLADGAADEVLTAEALEGMYRTEVVALRDAERERAFFVAE